MADKHELTERLKVIETEVHSDKIELNCLNYKLDAAYKYEDELMKRQELARKSTAELRNQVVIKHSELSKKYDKMKKIFEVFTANFYNH